jgi:hypothetical protein
MKHPAPSVHQFARRSSLSLERRVRSEISPAEQERGDRRPNEFKYQGRAHNPGCGRPRSRRPGR